MVSQNQHGSDSECETSAHRLIGTHTDEFLKSIHPMTVESATEFLGAANELDASTDVKEHFYEMVQQAKEN